MKSRPLSVAAVLMAGAVSTAVVVAAPVQRAAIFFSQPAPTFSHISSRYSNVLWLSITGAPGTTVRYTTNGAEPTASSPVFDAPFLIARRTTVKARAFAGGWPVSRTAVGQFVVEIPRRTTFADLHIVPTVYHDDPTGFLQACLGMEQWPEVLSRTLYFGSSLGIATLGDAELSACFKLMLRHRLQLTVETGVLNQAIPDATALFALQAPELRRFIRLGAPLSTIYVQEPWTSADGTTLTYPDIVRETAEWMALVRRDFPGIRLMLQEAYPFHSADELIGFVRDVNAAALTNGVTPLDGFELDHDWNIPTWTPAEIYRINTAVRAAGMRFSIIIWPAGGPTLDDCAFGRRTLRQYRDLYAAGYAQFGETFTPDVWSIESWSEIPVAIVPETAPCTFMQGARDIAIGL